MPRSCASYRHLAMASHNTGEATHNWSHIDIIIPTTEANFRADVLGWETKFRRALSTFSMRLLVILIVPVSPFQFNPNQVRDWVGCQTHFSSLTNKPALDRSELIKPELLVQVCISLSMSNPSSK